MTTVNRGLGSVDAPGVEALHADRSQPGELEGCLTGRTWDAVIDTWSGAPAVVARSSRLLRDRVGHYGYVSSASVYRWPMPVGADETTPTVDADPEGTEADDYAASKRGAELAVLDQFPDRALLARAGLILGPYENVGRLPWWLQRLARGGRVVAPGPPDRPLQFIDARDLASWMLSAADRGTAGAFNTVSRPGHTTIGALLDVAHRIVGSSAELVWVSPETIATAGVSGWTELPIWVPPSGELAALLELDVAAALAQGLSCRPIVATVADTWAWLQREGLSTGIHPRAAVGLDEAAEQRVLALDHPASVGEA